MGAQGKGIEILEDRYESVFLIQLIGPKFLLRVHCRIYRSLNI